jgi:hypothetical protein
MEKGEKQEMIMTGQREKPAFCCDAGSGGNVQCHQLWKSHLSLSLCLNSGQGGLGTHCHHQKVDQQAPF